MQTFGCVVLRLAHNSACNSYVILNWFDGLYNPYCVLIAGALSVTSQTVDQSRQTGRALIASNPVMR